MAAQPTIGEWTEALLVKFIQNMIRLHPPEASSGLIVDELEVVQKFKCLDQIQFSRKPYTTVGAAGTASALPANPVGYIPILDSGGKTMLIPYYNHP